MSVSSEQRRLMTKFEDSERRLRAARARNRGENGASTELSRFVDALEKRGEESRETRRRPSAEIRRESSNPAERASSRARGRDIGDEALIDAAPAHSRRPEAAMETSQSAQESGFRDEIGWPEPDEQTLTFRAIGVADRAAAQRRLLYFTALIIVIGVAGLTASMISWRKLSNPSESALIGRETLVAEPQLKETTDANRPAPDVSIVDAQPADVAPDDQGSAPTPASIPTPAAPSIPTPETAASAPPTREPADAKYGGFGPVLLAIEQPAPRPKLLFDTAPSLNLDATPQPPKVSEVEKASDVEKTGDVEKVGKIEREAESRVSGSIANCFVKVDGRVLISRSCQVSWTKQQRVTFQLAEKPLTISYDHGRTWLATLGSQELGKVYKTGSCWGSKRVYVCEHGK